MTLFVAFWIWSAGAAVTFSVISISRSLDRIADALEALARKES